MNTEKSRRLRGVKVIASEVLMAAIVIIMVIGLAFLVSGYWINPDMQVSRQGLLQLSSVPTGADVTIDGVQTTWLERTNMSRNMMSGEHTIELKKNGYDSWSKTIQISEGLLYRIHYPMLFLQNREQETVLDAADYSGATVSPDRRYLILTGETTEWATVNLTNEAIRPTEINVGENFMALGASVDAAKGATGGSGASGSGATGATGAEQGSGAATGTGTGTGTGANGTNGAGGTGAEQTAPPVVFSGEILNTKWDRDGSHVLMEVKFGEAKEWVLLDVKNPKNSVNITRQFGGDFTEVEILDNSANNLLVVLNGNLHRIDLGAKSISSVLVENVQSFDHFEQNEVVFSAKRTGAAEGEPQYYIGSFQIGGGEVKELEKTEVPARVVLSKFYEDKYLTTQIGEKVTVHKQDGYEVVAEFGLNFSPEEMKVGHNGEFITLRAGRHLGTLDMESMTLGEWEFEGEDFGWITDDMIYTVADGELIVYDYDGLNRRVLAENVSARMPVMITEDKWLYYFSDGKLVREWLVKR